MRESILKLKWALAPSTSQEFWSFIATEQQKWRMIAEQAKSRSTKSSKLVDVAHTLPDAALDPTMPSTVA